MSALDEQVGGSHYKDFPVQPVEFCQRNGLNYCESAAIKYICRHRQKNGRQDIEKAIHYLRLLLDVEYDEATPAEKEAVYAEVMEGASLRQRGELVVEGDEIPGVKCASCEE